MDTGILFNGMYLGSVSRQRQDGRQSFVVAVACGLRSYEITSVITEKKFGTLTWDSLSRSAFLF